MSPQIWLAELDCSIVRSQLSDYLEYEMSTDARHYLGRHIANCRNCATVYDGVRNVVQLLGDDIAFDLPTGFGQRLQEWLHVTSTQQPNHTCQIP